MKEICQIVEEMYGDPPRRGYTVLVPEEVYDAIMTLAKSRVRASREKTRREYESDSFKQFWAAYPKKIGKGAAWKAWVMASVPTSTVLAAIEAQKQTDQWRKDNGQFIPHPATWLNQRRWEDEVQKPLHGDDEDYK